MHESASRATSSIFADRRALTILATLCCLVWGSSLPAVKYGYALIGISPGDIASMLLFAGLRFGLAGVLLLLFSLLSGRAVSLTPRLFAQTTILGLGQTTL